MATTAQTRVVHEKIVAYVQRHPELKITEIAAKLNINANVLGTILKRFGVKRNKSVAEVVNLAELGK